MGSLPLAKKCTAFTFQSQFKYRNDICMYSNFQLDCKVPPTFPFPVTSDLDQPRCVALSQDDGVFSFPSLSPGHYTLVCTETILYCSYIIDCIFVILLQVPHYRHEQIVFDVHPPRLSFTVANDSLTVEVLYITFESKKL